VHSQLYGALRSVTCKELEVLEFSESGIERLMSTEGLCNESSKVEHTSEVNEESVPLPTTNDFVCVFWVIFYVLLYELFFKM
jgi:hypothetical protein